jgi:hypothetical protein
LSTIETHKINRQKSTQLCQLKNLQNQHRKKTKFEKSKAN